MEIEVTVRNGKVPDRAKEYARQKISRIARIFDRVGRVHVSLAAGTNDSRAYAVVHLDSGATLVAETVHSQLQSAIEQLSEKLTRQVRKEKERLIARSRRVDTPREDELVDEEPSYDDVIRKDLEDD
ncbi:MAG: ribosome hibernation-promoting factor, HPF/YfiA family [Planctomycetota bacterium]